MKKAPHKLLEWVWLDIVTAIPCATIYRNCKTQEIVERVRRDPTLLTVTGFRVLDFVSIRVLQLAKKYIRQSQNSSEKEWSHF